MSLGRAVRALVAAALAVTTATTVAAAHTAAPPAVPTDSRPVAVIGTADGRGYWPATAAGGVYTFGSAQFYGAAAGTRLNAPIVGAAATPSGRGYWLVAADGGVFTYGDAGFFGSMGGKRLNGPMVGMAATATGRGYWLTAADGGVFAFGDAMSVGSMGGKHLNAPVVGMAAAPGRSGYWLAGADGGVFGFGRARFYGSMGGKHLNTPVVGVARGGRGGEGYWLAAADGGVFAYGNAAHLGSLADVPLAAPIVSIGRTPTGSGFWLLGADGGVFAFGDAPYAGRLSYIGAGSGARRLPRDLTLSQAGADFIAAFEGFVSRPRPDDAGDCTVGYGHLIRMGRCRTSDLREWGTLSVDEGRRLLRSDVERRFVPAVRAALPHTPLHQHEFDALVAFVFNNGANPIRKSSSGVRQALTATPVRYGDVPARLLPYNLARHPGTGRLLPYCGLHRRRLSEGRLWATGEYVKDTSPCPPGMR